MNDEKSPQGQDETAREWALEVRKEEAERAARQLSGTLFRVTVHVTEREEESLAYYAEGTTVARLLERFVADLTGSERSVWPQCQLEARSWFEAHRYGEHVVDQLLKEKAEISAAEGGQS